MDPLLDPLKDRKIKKVKPPPHRPLAEKYMFPKKGSGTLLYRDFYIIKTNRIGN